MHVALFDLPASRLHKRYCACLPGPGKNKHIPLNCLPCAGQVLMSDDLEKVAAAMYDNRWGGELR